MQFWGCADWQSRGNANIGLLGGQVPLMPPCAHLEDKTYPQAAGFAAAGTTGDQERSVGETRTAGVGVTGTRSRGNANGDSEQVADK